MLLTKAPSSLDLRPRSVIPGKKSLYPSQLHNYVQETPKMILQSDNPPKQMSPTPFATNKNQILANTLEMLPYEQIPRTCEGAVS